MRIDRCQLLNFHQKIQVYILDAKLSLKNGVGLYFLKDYWNTRIMEALLTMIMIQSELVDLFQLQNIKKVDGQQENLKLNHNNQFNLKLMLSKSKLEKLKKKQEKCKRQKDYKNKEKHKKPENNNKKDFMN